jgi:hypothetical protein
MYSREQVLTNLNNYGPYTELATTGYQEVITKDINIMNWKEHIYSIVNILKDGIETDFVHGMKINIIFQDNENIELSIFDYFFNIILWHLIIRTGDYITSKHLFFEENITQKSIKKYIDNKFINVYRSMFSNMELNNIIDDTLHEFKHIDSFSFYLSNTINIEDNITLMNQYPEFYDIMHADLTGVPIGDVKDVGMKLTWKAIDYIKNSDHCLSDSFRAGEGISPKQYKEFSVNIGSKPDGTGGIFPTIINKSFINGGVNTLESTFIESSSGRIAQIIAKMNVGKSGHFARLLRLNTRDTIINQDPHYACDSKNFEEIYVKDEDILRIFENRYYRFDPHGMEYKVGPNDTHLIGKTLYFRSPMTCASFARGHGVCYRCYGDLAYTNCDINIGILASEILSSALTQRLLSAKHLLESLVRKADWSEGFIELFNVEFNVITLLEDFDYRGYKILIEPNSIILESEEDNYDYNEYVTSFLVKTPDGRLIPIYASDGSDDGVHMYISIDMNEMIRKYADPIDGKIEINMDKLTESNLFLINIMNDELSKTLEEVKSIINKDKKTTSFDRNQILQEFLETTIKGGLNLTAVHAEVIIANQLRSADDILVNPDWTIYNEPYQLITLNRALTDNPSITISMLYQKLSKALFNPLTFKKTSPSFVDLLFMEKPQEFMQNSSIIVDNKFTSDKDEPKPMVTFKN